MVRGIIWTNIILVLINVVLGVFAASGLFHDNSLLPLLIAASTILIVLISMVFRWKKYFYPRLAGIIVIILSGIWIVHAHFNIYGIHLESSARANSLSILYNKEAPALHNITTINSNEEVTLDELTKNNQFVIVNFWATWCPPCIKEMPLLNSFHNEFKNLGVKIIGFTDYNLSDNASSAQKEINKISRLIKRLGIDYSILIDDSQKVRLSYGAEVLPATVLISHDRKVIDYQIGIDGALKIMQTVRDKLKSANNPSN